MISHKAGLFRLMGAAFFIQALAPLLADLTFKPLESEDVKITLTNMVNHVQSVYASIILWIVTAVVIVMLGAALYQAAGHINQTMALIAFGLYLFEAVLVVVGQALVFGLLKASQHSLAGGETGLMALGTALLAGRQFAGEIAMVPFGIGGILYYYLLLKARIIPKWLALWGLITAPIILVVIPLGTFGIALPFVLCFPYVPFEFFTGIYVLITYRNKNLEKNGLIKTAGI